MMKKIRKVNPNGKNGTLVIGRTEGARTKITIPLEKLRWLVQAGIPAELEILTYRIKKRPGESGELSLGFQDDYMVFEIQKSKD